MTRLSTFTFRLSSEEREMIAQLADQLQRSQSDALRFVVSSVLSEMENRVNFTENSVVKQSINESVANGSSVPDIDEL